MKWSILELLAVGCCAAVLSSGASVAAQDACPRPCIVYISGGGSASDADINRRVFDYSQVFGRLNGRIANLKVFRPNGEILNLPFFPPFRRYSDQDVSDIVEFFNANPGTYVIASSAGAMAFREALPAVTNKQFGGVVENEPMFPFRGPPTAAPPGYDPSIHITMETDYTGDFSEYFKKIAGTGGSLIPNCSPPACYRISNGSVELNSLADILTKGMNAHTLGVGRGEDRAGSILTIAVRDGIASVRAAIDGLVFNKPVVASGGSGGNTPTGPTITGGGSGGAAGGGGVGVESFPHWLPFASYRDQLQRAQQQVQQ